MRKLIFLTVVASALSLTSCSFTPDLQNNQDNMPTSAETLTTNTDIVPETDVPIIEDITGDILVTETTEASATLSPEAVPAPPVANNDFSSCKEQYISRIDKCLQSMEKTIKSNLVVTENKSSSADPFWGAIAEKAVSAIDVNPIAIASAVGTLPTEVENSTTYESEFIPFVYQPVFGDAKSYSKLNPGQVLAVIAEKTFGISSKKVNVGFSENQNLYCTYIISNKNTDYAVISALYAYVDSVDSDKITKLGVETFARSYISDTDGCFGSICNISDIPDEGNFPQNYIIPEHRTMCDAAGTVVSTSYYYQRSSAKFTSINAGPSYLDDCGHVSFVHYVSWFCLT